MSFAQHRVLVLFFVLVGLAACVFALVAIKRKTLPARTSLLVLVRSITGIVFFLAIVGLMFGPASLRPLSLILLFASIGGLVLCIVVSAASAAGGAFRK